jgi:hypothetical protein
MPKLLKGQAQPVAQSFVGSALLEIVSRGGPAIITWLFAHEAALRGWALPWIIFVASLVFLAFSFGFHYLFRSGGAAPVVDQLSSNEQPQLTATATPRVERTPRKLEFEIDEAKSEVRVGDGGPKIRHIYADIWLRCLKHADKSAAVRAFHASLLKLQANAEPVTVIAQETNQSATDLLTGNVKPNEGWTIADHFSTDRIYRFVFDITPEFQESLSPEHVLSVTMQALGQEPESQTVYVDNWALPDGSASSGISLKPREPYPIEAQKEIERLTNRLADHEKANERLGRHNEEYEWLVELAKKQRAEIDNWVIVKHCEQGDLNLYVALGDPQTVILCIWVTNRSRLDISLSDDLAGQIKFQDMPLTETKEVINHVKDVPSGETVCLTIKQPLSPAEAQAIANAQHSHRPQFFNFDDLKVMIVGGKRSPDITPKALNVKAKFATAFPINLQEKGQRIRALAEIRGACVQLCEPLRIGTEPLPLEDIERWVNLSHATLERIYHPDAVKSLWREITHDDAIPTAASSQRHWLHACIVVLGSQLAHEAGEYIRQPQK